ncbi:cytochrome b-245 heavy chain-like [Sycon ciliatum]|uniref:cytochrome b-245 heavy chain-like n=1 Tax=Sycon ciliatum TaxID=27933 RepID=UPI0020A899E8|eukprot:scpid51330/ scgid20474/ Cytochrome b-245 heavy chain; CGD91-phox; Cytochrome b(558) subunit beta; Heme-binding membrane glycoprotein gp91phox; Neutrophil cytochrome b 91 kDa polypeptide; gp91-1; gp91-phox; p22 phagocyte B-cytochrome
MGDFLVNDFPRYFVLFIWIAVNCFMFGYFCWIFESEPKWFYLRLVLKRGLCLARGSAACLNLNCMLILIPVCRNLISLVRGSGRSVRRTVRRLLDKNITFHKIVAWSIVFFSAIHTGSHFWNYERICYIWDELPGMRCIPTDAQPINSPGPVPINVMWTTWAGFTGHIILVALFLMVTSSIEIIRRSYFEVFWYTHHLFVVFYACLIIHGFQGLLKGQTNTDYHDPNFCYNKYLLRNGSSCILTTEEKSCRLEEAQFAAGGAQTWKWVVGPLALYLLERLIRFYRAQQRVVITKVVQHPSKTIELQMQKKGFFAEAGQYIFMQVPEVSALEWHPFTLTSSPEERYFSVHIRVVGDWTEALAKRLGVGNEEFQQSYDMPTVNIDGPFGTASEDIFRFRVGVCIGAGIGVTPFASILKSIWYQMFGANRSDNDGSLKLQKVYVYWICPDTQAFEWFADLLKTLEDQLIENGMADFLDYNIYLTRGWDQNMAKNIMLHEDESRDVITGLQQKTHFGRPQWRNIFENMAAAHRGEDIGVFFCGPKILSSALHVECNRCTDLQNGTRFYYNKENF